MSMAGADVVKLVWRYAPAINAPAITIRLNSQTNKHAFQIEYKCIANGGPYTPLEIPDHAASRA